jgi:Flp pilus assembly pilin Flp
MSLNPDPVGGACADLQRGGPAVRRLAHLFKRNDGQTMAEYTTVLSVITIGCLLAFALLAAAVAGEIDSVARLLF